MAEETVDEIIKWSTKVNGVNGVEKKCRTAEETLLPAGEIDGVSGILPPKFERRVVEHYIANEWAIHLDDIMVRRTSWHYYCPDALRMAEQVADWMAELMGWTAADRTAELERYNGLKMTNAK